MAKSPPPRRFKSERARQAYLIARDMHEILIREASGRGMAYRRGWLGQPYDRSWVSYPVYLAGKDNRRLHDEAAGEQDA
ncbi:hypothetical protein J2T57_001454 [Natronocella acetinitrilica]|uniref:Uncharacterized protein n=1 Tax=Natronocella acetinitrilica TaxID=414046 RepID=A0AAE3G5Q4_9GAMM|nr:hypothetical protein [Natronocella acetinitrilica]MCP1674352.1 hypothetical protein [Natronocella acetinitrilica]